jgi:malate synthase
MIINALNSGANVYMSDFEDSNSPTWENCIEGQINLYDAVRKTIDYTNPKNERKYSLNNTTAVLFVRPRGLHLVEKNYLVDGNPIPASLFDFGVYFYNNYEELLKRGSRPYFYLPKLEHSSEAKLWNDIFKFAQDYVEINIGLIKATVLIETLPAVFQMEEILYELRMHSAGLNCGRWDYIFSFIKCFGKNERYILPDRSGVGMNCHFMDCYSKLLIETCHKRGAHAIGGMAAQIPIKDHPENNNRAMAKVARDKEREVQAGHDGTWVAHPGLVELAQGIFNFYMKGPNQISRKEANNKKITSKDLLTVPVGTCTEKMLKENVNIMFLYINSWLNGNGCVPLNHLMEDAATAEISRAQIWQWAYHNVLLDNRVVLNKAYLSNVLVSELEKYKHLERFKESYDLTREMCLSDNLDDFLTLQCYELIK